MAKGPNAFRTISEAAEELGVPQHVLRFWEGRFTQIKPLKLRGGRRYYRPEDMETLTTMQPSAPDRVSKKMLWAGYILSALPVLMLIFSAAMKFAKPAAVMEGFKHLGLQEPGRVGSALVFRVHRLGFERPERQVLTQTRLVCGKTPERSPK